jgi:hypothetical protein
MGAGAFMARGQNLRNRLAWETFAVAGLLPEKSRVSLRFNERLGSQIYPCQLTKKA